MEGGTKGQRTRARVLQTATRLINERGYCGTSINDVIQATGVKKGNLYFHFPGKEDLGLAILTQARKEFMLFLLDNLHGQRPLEKVSNLLDAVLEKQSRSRFVGG